MFEEKDVIVSELQAKLEKASVVRIIDVSKGYIELLIDDASQIFGGSYDSRLNMMMFLRFLADGGKVKVYIGAEGEKEFDKFDMSDVSINIPERGFGRPNS